MTNYQFQPSGMGGDRYTPNPHGPVNKPHKDFKQKLPVWESLRRELYQSFVEIDEAVKLVDRGDATGQTLIATSVLELRRSSSAAEASAMKHILSIFNIHCLQFLYKKCLTPLARKT
ncbi:hypothetical protein SNOG_15004 [Parastagonospora nodorum SN15]|uniref:Uncharacterized protein n=1 Tax=Phaeosphaeria nodorum (strain SN15 / ATCC MYA-4574 / FGSC 10173) TaxID=321614 RepID=Q0TZJ7_PHANO|nr:hypothetical protein SNOG_15004 [Parastagonospora nodorum SN15]EAT77547.1 hypothetical protein SNOG_15004 [Parastagonospora nodorum SN15]